MMHHPLPSAADLRPDLRLIASLISPDARVLDVGCGEGELLDWLATNKNVRGRGLELSQAGVNVCVAKGLSVIQGNADTDLADYPAGAFDYVVLSKTIQATHNPKAVLEQLVRIGTKVVVSFPNFGHWRVRLSLALQGRMPVTRSLDNPWYATPNIHLCTIRDFVALSDDLSLRVEDAYSHAGSGPFRKIDHRGWIANLTGEEAIFLLCGND